jgi:hypothetical protein
VVEIGERERREKADDRGPRRASFGLTFGACFGASFGGMFDGKL